MAIKYTFRSLKPSTAVLCFYCLVYSISSGASSLDKVNLASADDPHAHHKMMMQSNDKYNRIHASYDFPPLVLKDQHSNSINLHDFLHEDRPFIVSFIFTTCDTICPVLTATLASAQDGLMQSPVKPLLISISIDPEEDTPDKLKSYAKKFNASEDWIFLTGDFEDIIKVQRSLNIYRGSKFNHEPVTFIKAPGSEWLRLDGFTSASDLINEYRSYTNQ